MALLNGAVFIATAGGTASFAVSGNAQGYQTPAAAGAVDGLPYSYRAQSADLTQWEEGSTVSASGGTSFARTVISSSAGGTTTVPFTSPPTVALVAAAKDFMWFDQASSLSTPQQGRALANIGAAQFSLINGKIVESHASNIVTFAVKTFAGNDPSAIDPVSVIFSGGTQAFLTAALSVSSSNSFGTFGSTSGVPFRLWICIFNDGGTLRLGIRNCSDATGIYGFPGDGIGSSSVANNLAGGTWTGTVVTSQQFVIVGFADYDSGVTTAGTYTVSPTRIQLFGVHTKKPGDVVSEYYFSATPSFSTTSSTPATTNLSKAITPTSLYSVFKIASAIHVNSPQQGISAIAALNRSGTAIGNNAESYQNAGTALRNTLPLLAFDRPATLSSVTYAAFGSASAVGSAVVFGGQPSTLTITEVMG